MVRQNRMVCGALVVLAALLLTSCGGGVSQTAQTQSYKVTLTLDSAKFGDRTATIALSSQGGSPASVDQVVVAPTMQTMGMASPEVVAAPDGPGRYRLPGPISFTMVGEWEVDVRISAGGKQEVASFKVPITS